MAKNLYFVSKTSYGSRKGILKESIKFFFYLEIVHYCSWYVESLLFAPLFTKSLIKNELLDDTYIDIYPNNISIKQIDR